FAPGNAIGVVAGDASSIERRISGEGGIICGIADGGIVAAVDEIEVGIRAGGAAIDAAAVGVVAGGRRKSGEIDLTGVRTVGGERAGFLLCIVFVEKYHFVSERSVQRAGATAGAGCARDIGWGGDSDRCVGIRRGAELAVAENGAIENLGGVGDVSR